MASEHVKEFTSGNWDQEVVNSETPVLVDFWAPWCAPCRALGPTIERVADEYAGKIKVGKLNVDDSQDVAIRYGITSIPRVLIFKGGSEPREELPPGIPNTHQLAKAISRVLES
jgi:thioredoxin 1